MTRGGECQHQRGEYCLLHGGGAVKKFRMITKTTGGSGGIPIRKVTRQIYYECEEEYARGTKRQFSDVKRTTIPSEEDTLGGEDICLKLSLTTEGQYGTSMSSLPWNRDTSR